MTYTTRPLSGSLFKETAKKDPKHADLKGSLKDQNEIEYWLNGYMQTGSADSISLTAQQKNAPPGKTDKASSANRGELSRNSKKKDDKHPDYKGSLTVNGTTLQVSGWAKSSANGKEYISLSFSLDAWKPAGQDAKVANDQGWKQPKPDTNNAAMDIDIGVPPDFDD
jgi:uncharacterized protein (DUF736 family)